MPQTVHLAQVNIALAREPLDAPLLADFMAALAPVNASADGAPGFVWRMQTEDGDGTAVRGFGGDPRMIINLTVWESLAAMREFVYRNPEHMNGAELSHQSHREEQETLPESGGGGRGAAGRALSD